MSMEKKRITLLSIILLLIIVVSACSTISGGSSTVTADDDVDESNDDSTELTPITSFDIMTEGGNVYYEIRNNEAELIGYVKLNYTPNVTTQDASGLILEYAEVYATDNLTIPVDTTSTYMKFFDDGLYIYDTENSTFDSIVYFPLPTTLGSTGDTTIGGTYEITELVKVVVNGTEYNTALFEVTSGDVTAQIYLNQENHFVLYHHESSNLHYYITDPF